MFSGVPWLVADSSRTTSGAGRLTLAARPKRWLRTLSLAALISDLLIIVAAGLEDREALEGQQRELQHNAGL